MDLITVNIAKIGTSGIQDMKLWFLAEIKINIKSHRSSLWGTFFLDFKEMSKWLNCSLWKEHFRQN